MFGPIMRFEARLGLKIEMAPISRTDMPVFIQAGGMQSYEVIKFLGRSNAPVLEDEYEWFDNARADKDDVIWGIYVVDAGQRTLIGNTGLHDVNGAMFSPCKSATSGFMIFRPEFWGKGIAGACHKARTMYAFDMLGLVCIRSGVIFENEASRRAVESVGYAVHHSDRMSGLHKGEPRRDYALMCVNPDKYVWAYWWRSSSPPKRWRDARVKTTKALEWARQNIEFP
jgi:RimJ/RimL family protein N-acetyltransferase